MLEIVADSKMGNEQNDASPFEIEKFGSFCTRKKLRREARARAERVSAKKAMICLTPLTLPSTNDQTQLH